MPDDVLHALWKAIDAVEAARKDLTRLEREYTDTLLKAVTALNQLSPDDEEGKAALQKSLKDQLAKIQKQIEEAKEKLRAAEEKQKELWRWWMSQHL